eukprot:TRINITY_DN419_c0_g4_i1.p3 TRINITY_DN419_c0_g4~~TRINITY_DN419_c0_g4_i1.p3  ORF type:complete len:150 (-),score=2.61 TRINITY_DN419_c0_g4_i1:563-1012(-)
MLRFSMQERGRFAGGLSVYVAGLFAYITQDHPAPSTRCNAAGAGPLVCLPTARAHPGWGETGRAHTQLIRFKKQQKLIPNVYQLQVGGCFEFVEICRQTVIYFQKNETENTRNAQAVQRFLIKTNIAPLTVFKTEPIEPKIVKLFILDR